MDYPPKKLITRILEFAAVIALSAFLIMLAVQFLLAIWPYLLVIAAVIAAVYMGCRYRQNRSRW